MRATVTRSEGGADVSLETTDGGLRGARTLHGSTCDEVTSAAALVIALAIDPKAVAAHSQSTGVVAFDPPAVGPTSAPGGSPCPPPPVPNAPPPIIVRVPVPAPATSDVSAFLDAGVVADVGSLPGPSAGPTARAGIASHRFGARLGVAYLTPRFAAAPPEAGRPTRGADVSLVTSDLLGCYALIPGATALDVCGGLEAGALFAEGQAFQRSNAALKPWLAAVAGIELAVPVAGPLTLRAQLGAAVPFGRSPVQFRSTTGNITELREIYRPSVVDGRAVAAASVTFF